MFNLLTDRIISVRAGQGPESVTLPGLFVGLQKDAVQDFPALRAHQAPAWHAFLVQLAALATEGQNIPQDEASWADALRALTSLWPGDEPWHLVAPASGPALLQPALQGGDLKSLANVFESPDELDPLTTARNHDLKAARMHSAVAEDWLFALVMLQTMEGYGGKANYGIMRMNGGYGSRPFFGVVPSGGPGARFVRDLDVLKRHGNRIYEDAAGFATERQISLLWLETWDGTNSLSIADLHPLAIEICRRVRLVAAADGRLHARGTGTAAARVKGDDLNGVTGDPWGPVQRGRESKLLSVTGDGFGWRRMKELLFGDGKDRAFDRPLMARVNPLDGVGADILAAALARGQGKTEGFHSRRIAVTHPAALRALADNDSALKELAEMMAVNASSAANRCLRPALFMLFQKGPDRLQLDRRSTGTQVEPWMKRFDTRVDSAFFPTLWQGAENLDQAATTWSQLLRHAATTVLDYAAEAAPSTEQRQLLAAQKARDFLKFSLRKRLPLDTADREDPEHAA